MYKGEPLLEKENEAKPSNKESKNTSMSIVYDVDHPNYNEEKIKDYLELADFIMRETSSSCNGLWLKGSLIGYVEKALKLLHTYDYNYTLAKFHILYPSVMAIPERKQEILSSLTDKEMESIVQDAIIDLRGCKS